MQKERQSTFEVAYPEMITCYRRDGNTTRQIDNAVQILFSGKILVVKDHWNFGQNREANQNLFDRIMKRLSSEHGELLEKDLVKANRYKLEIELLDH